MSAKALPVIMISDHHALYYAHELTRHSGEGADRVGSALFDASVDLNPHQIEAALFHFRSPLTKGVLLADEVGLGKTIEAALILAQLWAERKRRLLIICPAALRKQWSLELRDKFNLPSVILDKKSFGATRKRGENPLNPAAILIVSYQFAMNLEREIAGTPWDLAVIDEAHKLRNCHRKSNRVGQSILRSLGSVRKVLLSATPLQNSLMEVYGLSRIIDGDLFGEPADFRRQFCRQDSDMGDLRARLALWVKRTLRNQVLEYIRYTRRLPVTIPFTPSPNERSLYDAVTDFLGRDQSYALPERQRMLVTMVVRKLLSSSSHALAGTLQTMRDRIEQLRTNPDGAESDLLGQLLRDEEIDAEAFAAREDESEENALLAEDDAPETDSASPDSGDDNTPPPASEKAVDQAALLQEIEALDKLIARARGIRLDEKTRALTDALTQGFAKMAEVGGARKVVIFTESRTTQEYLRNFLDAMPAHRGKVVLFNGSLGGPDERAIYENWLRVNRALGRVSGSAAADRRQAIIEHFRDNAEILIATESASEGVNLQFCSLLINYDLPWNPQRVEQRIGRCHRYGQKHDVVVINFLNRSNAADRRVLSLLQDKFTLFTGVFGASDSVLGTLSGGIDIEREIARILSASRTPEAINAAFTRLERDCEARILAARDDARKNLLDNFDEGVAGRLRLSLDDSKRRLDRISLLFWNLTRHILSDRADFDDKTHAFTLTGDAPYPDLPAGPYRLIERNGDRVNTETLPSPELTYRLTHRLGEWVLDEGKTLTPGAAIITFDLAAYGAKLSELVPLRGASGWLVLEKLRFTALDTEDFLLFSGFTDDGVNRDQEFFEKLFLLPVPGPVDATGILIPDTIAARLRGDAAQHADSTLRRALERNDSAFTEEEEKLEIRARDALLAAENELKELSERRDTLSRESRRAANLTDKEKIQQELRSIEQAVSQKRRTLFDTEDRIRAERDRLIDELAKRKTHSHTRTPLFTVRWSLV